MLISDSIGVLNCLPVNDHIFIRPLVQSDAESYWRLYEQPLIQRHFAESPFEPGETEAAFTSRIMGLCNHVWTIRKYTEPGILIGDCALHAWNKKSNEIEIGGVLHPSYWGEGIMTDVMSHVIDFAAVELQVKKIIGRTSKYNDSAVRLLQRLQFVEAGKDGITLLFQKLVQI